MAGKLLTRVTRTQKWKLIGVVSLLSQAGQKKPLVLHFVFVFTD